MTALAVGTLRAYLKHGPIFILVFAKAMHAADHGQTLEGVWYPGIEAGVEGVRWVENCVRSADSGAVWVEYQ
ncbi:hypothetical protein GCM10020331_084610 [Ectobacillus funiculus]